MRCPEAKVGSPRCCRRHPAPGTVATGLCRVIGKVRRVRLDYTIVADFAQALPDGKFTIVGGGVDYVNLPAVPGMVPLLSFVCRLVWEALDPTEMEVSIDLTDPDGEPVIPPFQQLARRKGSDENEGLMIVLSFSALSLARNGTYTFGVYLQGQKVGQNMFKTRLMGAN